MKRILLAFCLTMIFSVKAFAFPTISDNSWYVPTQTTKPVNTSQTTLSYDPIGDKVYMWNGHLPYGGYPQTEDMMMLTFNPDSTVTWSDLRPINSDMPPGA